jgi:hypothetical protein
MGPLPLIAAKHQSAGPENVLPQWQQKIAYAENIVGRCDAHSRTRLIFCTKCNFLQVLDLHIFLQKQPGHWAEVVCHFHLVLISRFYISLLFSICRNGRCKDM